jgi:hypothetical protein
MRPIAIPVLALGLAAAPAAAGTASLSITAVIPVSCSIDVVGVTPLEQGISLMVQRRCNTNHAVVLSAAAGDAIKDVTVRYNDNVVEMASSQGVVHQPERYFNGVDRMIVDMPDASAEQIRRYAASMSIGIETF